MHSLNVQKIGGVSAIRGHRAGGDDPEPRCVGARPAGTGPDLMLYRLIVIPDGAELPRPSMALSVLSSVCGRGRTFVSDRVTSSHLCW